MLRQIGLRALSEAAKLSGGLFAPHLNAVVPAILRALPGRLWDGKESLLDALLAVLKECRKARALAAVTIANADRDHLNSEYSQRWCTAACSR